MSEKYSLIWRRSWPACRSRARRLRCSISHGTSPLRPYRHPTEELFLQARPPAQHLRSTGWGGYAGLSSIGEELLVLRTKIRFDRARQTFPSAFRYRCQQSMLDLKKSPLKNGSKLRAQGGGKERRVEPRYPVAAMAEATEIKSNTKVTGRISDIGIGGCYFEVMSPFAMGAELYVRITRNEKSLAANAKVLYSTGGMGMGLIFTNVAPEQRQILAAWVGELSGSGVSPLTQPGGHVGVSAADSSTAGVSPAAKGSEVVHEAPG